jgi:hypothetical protein
MRSIYVPLPDEAADRLHELAQREFRDPRAEAAWLILVGLRAAGLDVDLATPEREESEPEGHGDAE